MTELSTSRMTLGRIVDVLLPLFLLALLVALNVQLLLPFVGLLLWTIILAICFNPVHQRLKRRGISNRLSATIIGTLLAAVILVPTAIAAISAASSVPEMVAGLQSGQTHVRPPPAAVGDIPLVGPKVHAAWSQASTDMPAFTKKFAPQLASFTRWAIGQAGGLIGALLGLVLAVIFAAITLAYSEAAREFIMSVFVRLTGDRKHSEHYMSIIGATVKSVANGVIGVAFVQALLCGIGFFVLGIPGAGILSIVAMVLGVLQVPVVIVTLPAIIYAFSVKTTTVAILFTVWFIISGMSDAVLKPLMIGHGLEVPMPIILLGVIGGVIAYGLVGLFIGAVLLAVGYILFREWLDVPAAVSVDEAPTLQAVESS
jgi:predicted PurR-regulated permease PerM